MNAGYGIHVRSDAEHLIEMELDITLQLNRKDIKPLFKLLKRMKVINNGSEYFTFSGNNG